MDHTCYKCGTTVEEGAPFCPTCRAPQIRVHIPGEEGLERPSVGDEPVTPPFPPGTPENLQPPARPVSLTKVRLRDALGSALAASLLVITCLLFWPAALLFAVAGGGALSVLLYIRRRPEVSLTTGGAARIGALNGVICAVMFAITFMVGFYSDGGAAIRQNMIARINASASSNAEAAKWWFEKINQPDSFAAMVVVGILVSSLVIVGLSSVGGAIAGRLSRRIQR